MPLTFVRAAAVVAVALTVALIAKDAVAQKPAPPIIIVVDLQKINREAAPTKSIRKQIGTYRDKYQKEFSDRDKTLRATNEQLQKQRPVLSPEAYTKKRRELEDYARNIQGHVQKIQRGLQRAQASSLSQVQERVIQIISKITAERGANLVLEKGFVVFTREGQNLDITKEVIARLNKELPTVQVCFWFPYTTRTM